MRLWHEKLIKYLPANQLNGQHRECCALRGQGWGRRHSTVDYVFEHSMVNLYLYHMKVMEERKRRGYVNEPKWEILSYRGKKLGFDEELESRLNQKLLAAKQQSIEAFGHMIYPEHNELYLNECMQNLRKKGVELGRTC